MAVYIYYYQYNLYMYDLCTFIRYLVSITQVLKYTEFGLDNWSQFGNTHSYVTNMFKKNYYCFIVLKTFV
jgi:hypothetical protein